MSDKPAEQAKPVDLLSKLQAAAEKAALGLKAMQTASGLRTAITALTDAQLREAGRIVAQTYDVLFHHQFLRRLPHIP